MEGGLLLCFTAIPLFIHAFAIFASGGQGIGVNYGMIGNNLPSSSAVISLYKSRGITKLRLFDPAATPLNALKNSGISVILGSLNEDLPKLASDSSFAAFWVRANVVPYADTVNFRCIDIGNELIPGQYAAYVLPAMRNIADALHAANLSIPVTTAIATVALETSYPPSQGAFSDEASKVMGPILSFLKTTCAPLMVNVYPYFAYSGSAGEVRLDYSLFTASAVVVQDGSLGYLNLFDAMLDSVYSAVERLGGAGVELVVSETGWPSAGGEDGATLDNARIYNNNLVQHVKKNAGTPKYPGKALEVYMFAMFNENLKPPGTERNFGMFYPNLTEVYHVDFY